MFSWEKRENIEEGEQYGFCYPHVRMQRLLLISQGLFLE